MPSSPLCRRTLASLRYCKDRKIAIARHVFVLDSDQRRRDGALHRMNESITFWDIFSLELNVRRECTNAMNIVYCAHYFSPCDKTGREVTKLELCRETCEYFSRKCDKEIEVAEYLIIKIYEKGCPYSWDIINCAEFHPRKAGHRPECWFYNGTGENLIGKPIDE